MLEVFGCWNLVIGDLLQIMSILSIDYGAKKVGLAKADDQTNIAVPLEVYQSKNQADTIEHIKNVCQSEQVSQIVVGLPQSMKADSTNDQEQIVKDFITQLKQAIDLPIETFDERLTSKQAGQLLKDSKQPDDAVAAMLILQSYLDKLNIKNKK